MSKLQVRDAMGIRDGDYIEIHNQWAKVVIARVHAPLEFVVTGDILDLRVREKSFTSLSKALAYAWASLSTYEQGAYR